MTKFDRLKRFILSRRTFRFGDVNKHFSLPVSSLNSYTTYLNYLVSSGYVDKTDEGVYRAADRKRLKHANVSDVKVRLRASMLTRLNDELEKKHMRALEAEWDLHTQLKKQEEISAGLAREVADLLNKQTDYKLDIEDLQKENGEKMIAFAVTSVVAALSLVGLIIAVFA